jgi:hypothetical protein
MALHRDIHWIGRQWAVTGFGMQLIDQKLKGFFDIEAARLWDDGLIEAMHAKDWLNKADFDKGLEIARKRYSAASGTVAPPVEKAVSPVPQAPKSEAPKLPKSNPIAIVPQTAELRQPPPLRPGPRGAIAEPPVEKTLLAMLNGQVAPLTPAPGPEAAKFQRPDPIVAAAKTTEPKTQESQPRLTIEPMEPPKRASSEFQVRFIGSAKFVRPWRVRQKQ